MVSESDILVSQFKKKLISSNGESFKLVIEKIKYVTRKIVLGHLKNIDQYDSIDMTHDFSFVKIRYNYENWSISLAYLHFQSCSNKARSFSRKICFKSLFIDVFCCHLSITYLLIIINLNLKRFSDCLSLTQTIRLRIDNKFFI
ncbi:hypothetical protein BpHYR1_025932 [Brachionus plicatilis]|uniref:Uncharacterized protein n=1 Tax=Brachionus plicatilis TaxID=10195 RepID=A0A3M7SMA0_BRAPC|nr:hypothetical protein BpHYR1_025932 [Brachionus plicatilis]